MLVDIWLHFFTFFLVFFFRFYILAKYPSEAGSYTTKKCTFIFNCTPTERNTVEQVFNTLEIRKCFPSRDFASKDKNEKKKKNKSIGFSLWLINHAQVFVWFVLFSLFHLREINSVAWWKASHWYIFIFALPFYLSVWIWWHFSLSNSSTSGFRIALWCYN